jgi:hypothetical protein
MYNCRKICDTVTGQSGLFDLFAGHHAEIGGDEKPC